MFEGGRIIHHRSILKGIHSLPHGQHEMSYLPPEICPHNAGLNADHRGLLAWLISDM